MKIKKLFEEVLEENHYSQDSKFLKRQEFFNIESEIKKLKQQLKELKKQEPNSCGKHMNLEMKIKKLQSQLKESTLSEMAADEKQRRIKQLQDQLTQVTDELRNVDPKDLSRKQQITNRRFEIQKQLNTLRQIEVTK